MVWLSLMACGEEQVQGFCSERPAPIYADGDESGSLGSGNHLISLNEGTAIDISGLAAPGLTQLTVEAAEFGTLQGPNSCDGSYELSVRATLGLQDQQVLGWLWWTLDADGEVLPGRLSMPAGETANAWAQAQGILDGGILGLEVEGAEARLFRAASFDDDLLLFTDEEPLPDLSTGTASWSGP